MQERDFPPYADDEINLADLAASIWRIRGVIVGAALAAIALAVVYLSLQYFGNLRQESMTGYIELTAISNDAYPSGAAFSPSDLTSGEVIADLRSRLDLPESLDINSALSVEYGHPAAGALRHERDIALARANDSDRAAADVADLRATYQDQIDALNRSGLRIRLNFTAVDLSEQTAQMIIEALPASWQQVYGDRYRILMPTEITRLGLLSVTGDFRGEDAPLAAEQYLRQAHQTLNSINEDARFSMITSPSGATASELTYQIDQFRQLFFDPFLASQISNENNVLGQLFVRQLSAQRRELELLLQETTRTIETVANMRGRNAALPDADAQETLGNNPVLSLSDNGLDSIVDLAQQSGMQDYLTRLFERRYELTEQVAAIETQIEKFTSEESLKVLDRSDMDEIIAERFRNLEAQISALVDTAYARARERSGKLYEFLAGPSVPKALPEPSRTGIILALAGILGAMVGLFGGLLLNVVRQKG